MGCYLVDGMGWSGAGMLLLSILLTRRIDVGRARRCGLGWIGP